MTEGGGSAKKSDPPGTGGVSEKLTPTIQAIQKQSRVMARPRTPIAKAEATGQTLHNPKRFKDRKEPSNVPIGEPSRTLKLLEIEVWEAFKRELPWLTEGDRSIVEAACMLRARLWAGSRDDKVIGRLLPLLNQMGATPAARTKVSAPNGDQEDNPAESYLQ